MIGPIRPNELIYSIADWGLTTPTLPGFEVRNLHDNASVIPHSTTVLAIGGNGYRAEFTIDTPGTYSIAWDDSGGTPFFDEQLWVADVVLISGGSVIGSGGVQPIYTAQNPLRMKRYDTKPDLVVQLLQRNGVDPYPIPAGAEVWFTVQPQREQAGGFVPVPLIHKQMTITDDANGIVTYLWDPADLTFYGDFLLEVEVNTVSGDVLSFPGADSTPAYIPFTILPDEDPAITP
jgi:hypothetical protein